MASQDPLSELADIHLPGAISIWPPALGWWLLAGTVIALLVFAQRRYVAAWVKRQRLSAAMTELDKVYLQYQRQALIVVNKNQAGLVYLQGVNSTLRRVALLNPPAEVQPASISKLNGSAWLSFLDGCDNSTEFSKGPGQALAEGIYQRNFNTNAEALYNLAQRWIQSRYAEKGEASSGQTNKTNADTHKIGLES